MKISKSAEKRFQRKILQFAMQNRRDYPWRNTRVPYRILVSEIMLQQTQTDRVINYYRNFLRRFPTIKALAQAPLAEVLSLWQGLGYNRRARYLWEFARTVQRDYGGRLPSDAQLLRSLPGIGPYTAHALAVFAFSQTLPMIETNIRAVYIDHFFPKKKLVNDRELLPLIEQTIYRKDPREWFYALMDYGSNLKKKNRALTARSTHYVKQSKFIGSRRQLRGAILRLLIEQKSLSLRDLRRYSYSTTEKLAVLQRMCEEKLIVKKARKYQLSAD